MGFTAVVKLSTQQTPWLKLTRVTSLENHHYSSGRYGRDYGLSVVIPACVATVSKNSRLHLLVVGQESLVRRAQAGASQQSQISIVNATEVVHMDEPPSAALRNKKTPPCAWRLI